MIISDFRKGDRLNLLLKQGQTKKKKRRSRLVFLGMIFLSLSFVVYFFSFQDQFISPPMEPIELASPPSEEPEVQGSPHQIIEGSIRVGSTFFQSLAEKNVSPPWIELIISKLRAYVDFRKIKGGSYRVIMDEKGKLVKFIYEAGPTEFYEIKKDSQGYVARRKDVPLDAYRVKDQIDGGNSTGVSLGYRYSISSTVTMEATVGSADSDGYQSQMYGGLSVTFRH